MGEDRGVGGLLTKNGRGRGRGKKWEFWAGVPENKIGIKGGRVGRKNLGGGRGLNPGVGGLDPLSSRTMLVALVHTGPTVVAKPSSM